MSNRYTTYKDLGLIDYKKAWDYQLELFNETISRKAKNYDLAVNEQQTTYNYLLFCEHPHVYTLGKSGSDANLLIDFIKLKNINAEYYKIERGGDITYHGPGQIVGYPILDLDNFGMGVKEYIYNLEESIILTLAEYNINAGRLGGATGVWLDTNDKLKARKICAIGVRTSRFTTMHGFAFNVNTDLQYFSYINPCGFTDKSVTSMEKELGSKQDFEKVKLRLKNNIRKIFDFQFDDW
jgi:lipoyl(octanoyl) transferase